MPRICFAWSGKHATEFEDANQGFRWQVVGQCLAAPESASPLLLESLFLADAEWSAEAWCAPPHFAQLGSVLLTRGREGSLGTFAKGFIRSFDTFGACHELELSAGLIDRLRRAADPTTLPETDLAERKALQAVRELLEKLEAGTASEGWAKLAPGTPISNVRVVWPVWYQRIWTRLSSFCRRVTG